MILLFTAIDRHGIWGWMGLMGYGWMDRWHMDGCVLLPKTLMGYSLTVDLVSFDWSEGGYFCKYWMGSLGWIYDHILVLSECCCRATTRSNWPSGTSKSSTSPPPSTKPSSSSACPPQAETHWSTATRQARSCSNCPSTTTWTPSACSTTARPSYSKPVRTA
jgi:hypothetical protein